MALARKHRLTVHDAAHLDLAVRPTAPIATLDQALAGAARPEDPEVLYWPPDCATHAAVSANAPAPAWRSHDLAQCEIERCRATIRMECQTDPRT